MSEAVYYDGAFLDIDEYAVKLDDRGVQFGDGVFETVRVYGGRCFAVERHLERYRRSMRELHIPITDTDGEMLGVFNELIENSGITDGIIYFRLTRGTAPRAYAFPERMLPHLTVILRDTPIHADWQEEGIRVALVEDMRWLRCDIGSLNLLANVLAEDEARRSGAKKALLFRREKNAVTECSDANFFLVKDDVLWTHPEGTEIFSGVTRAFVKDKIAPKLGLTVVEKTLTPEFAYGAEEAFATNTEDEILPVTAIGRNVIGSGEVGGVTRAIQKEYRALVAAALEGEMN